MGHSAGGHLAFWIAGRHHVAATSEVYLPRPQVPVTGAIAGAVDLRLTIELSGFFTFAHDRREVYNLMGGKPKDLPGRYRAGNPGELLPLNVPQVLLQGTKDDQIPATLPERWAAMERRLGDRATVTMVPGADHFAVVDYESRAWPAVAQAVRTLLER